MQNKTVLRLLNAMAAMVANDGEHDYVEGASHLFQSKFLGGRSVDIGNVRKEDV